MDEEGLSEGQFSSTNIQQSSESLSSVGNGLTASLGMSQQTPVEGAALMGGNLPGSLTQFQPGQALVMENGQIHILTQAAPLVSVDGGQNQPGDFIQILTSDGQLQHFALAKNKIQAQPVQAQNIQAQPIQAPPLPQSIQAQSLPAQSLPGPALSSIQGQQFSFLPSLAQPNTARIVSSVAQPNINIHQQQHQAMGDIHSVNPSLMSLAPAPLLYNTSTASTSQQSVYPASNTTEADRGVNKSLVSDWDSDDDCQD